MLNDAPTSPDGCTINACRKPSLQAGLPHSRLTCGSCHKFLQAVPSLVPAMASLKPKAPLEKWEYSPAPLGPQDIDIQVRACAYPHASPRWQCSAQLPQPTSSTGFFKSVSTSTHEHKDNRMHNGAPTCTNLYARG